MGNSNITYFSDCSMNVGAIFQWNHVWPAGSYTYIDNWSEEKLWDFSVTLFLLLTNQVLALLLSLQ